MPGSKYTIGVDYGTLSGRAVVVDISDGTVKVHVKHLLKKLNLRSRVEAAVWMVNHQARSL